MIVWMAVIPASTNSRGRGRADVLVKATFATALAIAPVVVFVLLRAGTPSDGTFTVTSNRGWSGPGLERLGLGTVSRGQSGLP
jgi:hypothetical protein